MFLQNMTVVSQSSTVKCILKQPKNDERPKVLPTLIELTRSNSTDTSSTVNIFGLLINVSLHSKGANGLRRLGAASLACETIRLHPADGSPDLLASSFALLHETYEASQHDEEGRSIGLAENIIAAMKANPEDEMLHVNACHLLARLSHDPLVRGLIQEPRAKEILQAAKRLFPLIELPQ